MRRLWIVAVGIALLFSSAIAADLKKISTEEAKAIYDKGTALFLDARGFKLYQIETIMGSLSLPPKKFSQLQGLLPANKDAKIVSFCNGYKCHKSDKLAEKLVKAGYTDVVVYPGGYPEWKENDHPLMGIVRECKGGEDGEYTPKRDSIMKNGVMAYPGGSEGMVDQFWLAKLIEEGALPSNIQLVDTRPAKQFKQGHLKGAINVVYDSDSDSLDESKLPKDKLSILYCNTGMMSTDAYMSLSKEAANRALYFDAKVECEGTECEIEPNPDLSDLL